MDSYKIYERKVLNNARKRDEYAGAQGRCHLTHLYSPYKIYVKHFAQEAKTKHVCQLSLHFYAIK